MNFKSGALTLALCATITTTTTVAFVTPSGVASRTTTRLPLVVSTAPRSVAAVSPTPPSSSSQLYSSTTTSTSSSNADDEVERLMSMAAKYRAEAAALEAEKAQQMAEATERAFSKLDTNRDGEISLQELKDGLEKVLKTELKEERVQQLMKEFDVSGDGALQLNEFQGIGQFSRRLEQIVREEKAAALEAKKAATKEAEAAALAQAKLELINDREPSLSDKVISILPYLFPLLDGLQFGRFLLDDSTGNPLVGLLATVFLLYRSVPFSGFIAFIALQLLSGNLSINRLIRYNMQQAIFLDIALFLPSLVAGVYTLILSGLGDNGVPEIVTQVGNDAVFVALLATIAYCTVSSALGITPDKLPFISDMVSRRMPTIDMFDEEGKFIPRFSEKEDDDDDDKKD